MRLRVHRPTNATKRGALVNYFTDHPAYIIIMISSLLFVSIMLFGIFIFQDWITGALIGIPFTAAMSVYQYHLNLKEVRS